MALTAQSSVGHYENFPVASILIPAKYRSQIIALYRFARYADDLADEGDDDNKSKLQKLDDYLICFDYFYSLEIEKSETSAKPNLQITESIINSYKNYTAPLAQICSQGLPDEYPRRLISAFSYDLQINRYKDFTQVLNYCKNSANPIGASLLYFYNKHQSENLKYSDAICSSLQLINFWQDIAIDWQKNRIYIPADILKKYGFMPDGSDSIALYNNGIPITEKWSELISEICEYARTLMQSGEKLPKIIGGRAGFELKLVVAGGLMIIDKILKVRGDVFNFRPTLGKIDWMKIFIRSIIS